jgi:hypothetical protein
MLELFAVFRRRIDQITGMSAENFDWNRSSVGIHVRHRSVGIPAHA